MGELELAEKINRKAFEVDNYDIQAITCLGNTLFSLNVNILYIIHIKIK